MHELELVEMQEHFWGTHILLISHLDKISDFVFSDFFKTLLSIFRCATVFVGILLLNLLQLSETAVLVKALPLSSGAKGSAAPFSTGESTESAKRATVLPIFLWNWKWCFQCLVRHWSREASEIREAYFFLKQLDLHVWWDLQRCPLKHQFIILNHNYFILYACKDLTFS